MLEPKNTLVGLAGQKAWHICTGDALPRVSGKYFPSQLRTQKAGPDPAIAGRAGGGAACWLRPKGSKTFACGCWCCCDFCPPPKKKSSRLSADTEAGKHMIVAAMVAAT